MVSWVASPGEGNPWVDVTFAWKKSIGFWLVAKTSSFLFQIVGMPTWIPQSDVILAGRRMNYHLAHIWYIPSSMLTTCFTVAHWVWASAYPQIHESRLSIYGGSPGPQSLRISLSLTMVEFSVESFTLFMCWRVFWSLLTDLSFNRLIGLKVVLKDRSWA